jgi:hypothetical protein
MNRVFLRQYIRRFSILHNKPKANKLEPKVNKTEANQIPQNKISYINYDIKFNDNGLYLLAENPNKRKRMKEIFLIILSIQLFLIDFKTVILALVFSYYKAMSLYKFPSPKLNEISEIYLTKDTDKFIIRYSFSGLYKLCNVKNIKLLNENEFNADSSNKKQVLVKIDDKPVVIPSDIVIYNRELFCAIFNGYEVKQFNKPGYIKLKTNDSFNYNV